MPQPNFVPLRLRTSRITHSKGVSLGTSTVVDLRRYELDGVWAVLREGAVPEREIELAAEEA